MKTLQTDKILNAMIKNANNDYTREYFVQWYEIINNVNSDIIENNKLIEEIEKKGFTEFSRWLQYLNSNIFKINISDSYYSDIKCIIQ